jgi:hypothetical protein
VKNKARHLDVERPDFHGIRSLEFDVHPGETLTIPHSWFHEVHTLSTSISLTYNFFLLRDILKVAKVPRASFGRSTSTPVAPPATSTTGSVR